MNKVGTSVGPRPKHGSTLAESVDSTRLRRPAKLVVRTLITEGHQVIGATNLNLSAGAQARV